MKTLRSVILLSCLVFSAPIFAVVTSPVSAVASSTFYSYQLNDLINQNGIVGSLEGGLHGIEYTTMWLGDGGDVTPTLTFDMGTAVRITSAHIWQYNFDDSLTRGVNGFDVSYSLDNIDFTPLTSANLTIAPNGNIAAQVVPMFATARYIRFVVTSNHGGFWTGLSEVAFNLVKYIFEDGFESENGAP